MINKDVFSQTKNRLIKINILVVGSFLIIFSLFIFSYFKGLTYNSIDKELKSELESIAVQMNNSSFFYPMVINDPRNMVYIYENNRIRYYSQNGYFEDIFPKFKGDKSNDFFTYTENGYTFRELNVSVGKYKIQILRNIDSEVNSFRQLGFVLLIGILISILITYYAALYLTKKALIPIETAWNNQSKFIQDASHELRTPVTIVSSKLEHMLKVPNNTIGDEVELVADAMKETRRIKKMISDLLSLTKEEAIVEVNLESMNVCDLIKEISNNYIDIAQMQNKKIEFTSKLKNEIIITDKNKLRQIVLIFVDNAFKYTNINDIIKIELMEKDSGNISILIEDTGIGIKESEVPFIFDRFFRSENVRNKDIDGSGIGLSIARKISLSLNLKIKVSSILNKGTCFEIIVPRKSSSKK